MEVKCQRFGKSSDMSSDFIKSHARLYTQTRGEKKSGRMDLAKEKGGDIIGKAN